MKYVLLAAVLFVGCAPVDPVVAKRAGIQRVAGWHITQCVKATRGHEFMRIQCLHEAERICVNRGEPKDCWSYGL